MTQLLNVDEQRRDQLLTDAADRSAQVIVSRRGDTGWTTYKSHILQADSCGDFLVIARPVLTPGAAPVELVAGDRIGLTFRRGHKKCMCAAEVIGLEQHALQDGHTVPAIRIGWPDSLQEMQRRLYFRAAVPPGRRIEVCMWEGCARSDAPAPLQDTPHHVGLLQDVSAGGCRVLVDASRDPQLEVGDTIALQFQPDPRTHPIRIEAMFRHDEEAAGRKLSLGFQFVGLETSVEGRQVLQAVSRVVSTFLRIELRRKKMRVQKQKRR